MTTLKILVFGSVDGNFSKFFKKVSSIQKKNGPFEMVLCCGNFFSDKPSCEEDWKKILTKKPKVDIPVYILGPATKTQEEKFFMADQIDDGQEIYENILYLGRKGVFTATSGLTLGYVSGYENKTKNGVSFTKSDIDRLKEQSTRDDKFKGVDILITTIWPKGIEGVIKSENQNCSKLLADLAVVLQPRYHFTSHSENFYEPPPYRNHEILQEQKHVSRFISVAPFINDNNQKGLYAFSMTPMSICDRSELIKQPEVVVPCPYKSTGETDKQDDQVRYC